MIKHKLFLIFFLTIFFSSINLCPVYAQTESTNSADTNSHEKATIRDSFKKNVIEKKQNIMERREIIKDGFDDMKRDIKEMKDKREQIRDQRKEELVASREAFVARLKEIKDSRKKNIVENVDKMLANINRKQTDVLLSALNKMSSILDNMRTKAQNAKDEGQNTALFDTAAQSATNTIENALLAVEEQASKTYSININSEDTLKKSVLTSKQELENDLHTVRDLVKKAKEALVEASHGLQGLNNSAKISITISPSP